ncbi:MAG: hypothetical protein AAFQ74_01260 [Cyanobacteria bacterium J06623_4]
MLTIQKLNLKPGVILLFSLGCHSLLFLLPWPGYQRMATEERPDFVQEQSVQPPAVAVVNLPVGLPSTASQPSQQMESVAPVPESVADVIPIQPSEAQVNSLSPAQASSPASPDAYPDPVVLDPLSTEPVPAEPVPTEHPHALPDNDAFEDVSHSPSLPSEQGTENKMVVQLDGDFPHLAGAQAGCYGLESCHQLSGNFRQAAQQLITQMESQGYQLTEREDIDGTGHRVFEVTMPDDPNTIAYLNVYSPDVGSTVYVLTADILSLEQLQQLNA